MKQANSLSVRKRRIVTLVALIIATFTTFGSAPASAASASSTCTAIKDGNGEFDITWSLGSGVDKYVIERNVNNTQYYWRGSVNDPGTSFHDGTAWHNNVTFRIVSKTSAGVQIGQPADCGDTASASSKCTAIKLDDGTFDVSWRLGDGVVKHVVERRVNNSPYYWRGAVNSPSTFFNDGTAWHSNVDYRVVSKTAAGVQIGQPTDCTDGTSLFAVGDMTRCSDVGNPGSGAGRVNQLVDARPDGQLLALGDLAYADGRDSDFDCFHDVIGSHKADMIPTVGNHEYGPNETLDPTGYWNYFRNNGIFATGHGPQRTVSHDNTIDHLYYEKWVDGWQILVLNSECFKLEEGDRADGQNGCDPGSLQYDWLEARLINSPNACRIATMHKPVWTSNDNSNVATYTTVGAVTGLVDLLDEYGTDLLLSGHSHKYENFSPQDANQNADAAEGFQLMVIGTGGTAPLQGATVNAAPNSATVEHDDHGVVQFELGAASYSWEFITADTDAQGNLTEAVLDSGNRQCVNRNN